MSPGMIDSLLNLFVFVFVGVLLYLYFRPEKH